MSQVLVSRVDKSRYIVIVNAWRTLRTKPSFAREIRRLFLWDARLTSVLILFFIYPGVLCFQQFFADVASISICIGLINIPIIKFSVNWWNTLHQPSNISQFGTPIHISMLIPILLILTSFLCGIFFILETRQIILSFF